MSVDTKATDVPVDVLAALQETANHIASGIRDPEAAKRARAETDRVREEIFRKHGILDIGVPAIRELRDR
jgi:hypothetical protein